MNRSKIEYCDHTLNIITGCRYKCEYCYARQMSRRFSGNVKMNIKQRDKYRMENGVYTLHIMISSPTLLSHTLFFL